VIIDSRNFGGDERVSGLSETHCNCFDRHGKVHRSARIFGGLGNLVRKKKCHEVDGRDKGRGKEKEDLAKRTSGSGAETGRVIFSASKKSATFFAISPEV
jgi:hypothetical protein